MECVSKTADGRKRRRRDTKLTAKVGRRFEVGLLLLGLASRNGRDCEGDREADCEGGGLHLSFRWLARFVLADGGADGPVLGRRDARVSVAPDPASIRLMRARVPLSQTRTMSLTLSSNVTRGIPFSSAFP